MLPFAVRVDTHKVVAMEVSTDDVHDVVALPRLVEEVETRRSRDGDWAKRREGSTFGYKLHTKADNIHGLVRSLDVMSASVHDSRAEVTVEVLIGGTVSTLYSGVAQGKKGQYIDFSTINDGDPINWRVDTPGSRFRVLVRVDFTSPYHLSVEEYSDSFEVCVPLEAVNLETDKTIYDVSETVHIYGDITAAGDVSTVTARVDVVDAGDESVIQNLVLNQIVEFQEGVSQTLKEINYGQDVKWDPLGVGQYRIKLEISNGVPSIENLIVYSDIFEVSTSK